MHSQISKVPSSPPLLLPPSLLLSTCLVWSRSSSPPGPVPQSSPGPCCQGALLRGQRAHSGGGHGTLQGPVRPAAVYRGVSVFHSQSMQGGGGDGVKPAVCVCVCGGGGRGGGEGGTCSNIGKGLLEQPEHVRDQGCLRDNCLHFQVIMRPSTSCCLQVSLHCTSCSV